MAIHRKRQAQYIAGNQKSPKHLAPASNTAPDPTDGPRFAQPAPTPDPTKFTVMHGSDKQAYAILDSQAGTLLPREIPPGAEVEPRITLADALGETGTKVVQSITRDVNSSPPT